MPIAAAQEPKAEYAVERVQSFKGTAEDAKDFAIFGPDAATVVKFEPEGLRITIPTGTPADRTSVGVASRFAIKGDFEITVRYEVLKEPAAVDSGVQTRLAVAITLDKPNSKQDQAAINYRVIPGKGSQIFAWLSTKDDVTSKPKPLMKGVPAKGKTGQLRMVRAGAMVSFFSAEGND